LIPRKIHEIINAALMEQLRDFINYTEKVSLLHVSSEHARTAQELIKDGKELVRVVEYLDRGREMV